MIPEREDVEVVADTVPVPLAREERVVSDALVTSRVTRFEVIDETGRIYSRRPVWIQLSYQDEGRTLKVFIEERES